MKIYIICITVVVLSVLAIVFGYLGYPPQGNNDASWYVAPGINLALTGKFESPFYWGDSEFRVGNGPFLSYPPLFPLFISLFVFPGLNIPIPAQIFIGISIITAVVLALSARALYKIATMYGKNLDWLSVLIICASLFMILRLSWNFGGRPEVLARLFFTIGFVLLLRAAYSSRLAMALGLLLGFLAATHVMAPMFFAVFTAAFFALRYDLPTCLKKLAAVAGTSVISFITAMQFSPYGILETIRGTREHGALMFARTPQTRALLTLFESVDTTLFLAVGALLLFFGARFFVSLVKEKKIGSPFLFFVSLAFLAAYTVFAIANARNNYITPFFVIFFGIFLYYIVHVESRKYIKRFFAAAFIVIVIVSMKNLALFPFFLKDGVSFAAAREKFAEVMREEPDKPIVLAGSHLWSLSELYLTSGKMLIGAPENLGVSEYFLFKEEWELPDAPLTMEFPIGGKIGACSPRHNFYVSKKPSIFGITLAHTTPGYGFVVYDCSIPDEGAFDPNK